MKGKILKHLAEIYKQHFPLAFKKSCIKFAEQEFNELKNLFDELQGTQLVTSIPREQLVKDFTEMVAYIIDTDDKDVIASYVDTFISGVDEYVDKLS